MKLIYILFSFFVFFSFALPTNASTSYETSNPIQSIVLTTSGSSCCSYEDNYRYWNALYVVPVGTTFNKIQLAVDVTTGSSFPLYFYVRQDNGISLSSATTYSDATSGDTLLNAGSHFNATQIDGELVEVSVPTTTITASNQYIHFSFVPAGYTYTAELMKQFDSGTYTGCNVGSYGSVTCSSGTSLLDGAPSMRLCNGDCPTTGFSPIPNLTPEPWARLISPNSGSTVLGGQSLPLQFQVNTGTSTADNVQIRFSSELQSLIPYDYDLTVTGINSFTYNLALPSFDDTIQFIVDVRSGTTSLVTSPDYTINVTTNPNNIDLGLTDTRPSACDNMFVGALCSIAEWLFFPGEISTTFFSNTLDSLNERKPFSYFSEASDIIQTTASTATTSEFVNLEVTIPIIGTSLPILTKDSLDSIYPTDTRLLIRTVIAYGLWILLILTLLYMLLNIFNKAVYMGEHSQQQSFENRVKTKHER